MHLNFGLNLHIPPYFEHAISKGAGETAHLCRLTRAFAAHTNVSNLLCVLADMIIFAHQIDFRCFYPCEIILTYPYQPMGKIKNKQADVGRMSICDVKITSPTRISAYSGFSGSIFHVIPI